jgi:hypothetical protein
LLVAGFGSLGAVFTGAIWLGCSSSSSGGNGPTDAGQDSTYSDHYTPPVDAYYADNYSADGYVYDGGGDAGVVSCADYCATVLSACGNADAGGANAQYYDTANCMNVCNTLIAAGQQGTFGDQTGNTVACRQYHAHAAATANPTFHCPHAGPGGGTICGDRCPDYCSLVMGWCTVDAGANPPYANNADCLAACAGYPYLDDAGDYDPTLISTLNCLDYHLREGMSDLPGQGIAGGHCDDLSIDGGTVRGACHP